MTHTGNSVWLQTRCACTWSRNDAWPRLWSTSCGAGWSRAAWRRGGVPSTPSWCSRRTTRGVPGTATRSRTAPGAPAGRSPPRN